MGEVVIPTLTLNGYIGDIDEILNKIYYYYVTSDYTQSNTFFGEIKSLEYALKRADYKPEKAAELVNEDLSSILHKYFNNYNVDASDSTVNYSEKATGDTKIVFVLDIELEVIDKNGKRHSLSKSIEIDRDNNIHFKESLDYLFYYASN